MKILIAADDAASKKFRDVEDAADKFKERLQEINGVLTAGGLTKIAGPLTSIASKLGVVGIAGKALHSTLSLVGEGADEAIRRKFAEPLADASTAIENLKGGLRDVGKAIAEAFADSNFGQISRRLLGYAAAPLLTGELRRTRHALQCRSERKDSARTIRARCNRSYCRTKPTCKRCANASKKLWRCAALA